MLTAPLIPVAAPSVHVVGLVYLNTTIAFQIVSFLILLTLLRKWLFKPMLAYLDKRAEGVKDMLDDVSQAKEAAEADRETATRELDAARGESYAIRAQAREIAGSERERMLDEARAESEALVERTQREIAQSVERARESLSEQTGLLAIAMAEKLLRSDLSDEQKRKATTVYANEMEGL